MRHTRHRTLDQRRCLGLHRAAPVGVQCQLVARHGMFLHRVDEQFLELGGAFRVLDAPANHPAAEDVEDDIEIEVGPFHGAHQFCDVPGPDMIGCGRQQFWLCIDGVCALSAALGNFAKAA